MIRWSDISAAKEMVVSGLHSGLETALGVVLPHASVIQLMTAVHARELINGVVYASVFLLGLFVIVYPLERISSVRRTRYAARVFRQDICYSLFYKSGAFQILVWAAVANALEPRLDFLKLGLARDLPGPVAYVFMWFANDFLYYWWHRGMHKWNVLWAFHSVHHSQEEMSYAPAQRLHPVEVFGENVIKFIPLLVLDIPTYAWLPIGIAMNVFLALEHSAVGWGYGKAYYLFVSPRFHALHHSSDPREYNGNYSQIFSGLDFLFGTGLRMQAPPARLGVDGLPVPRTLWEQFMAPFHILRGKAYIAGQGDSSDSSVRAR